MPYVPLAKPMRITEHQWPPDTKPVVSICCITYNHGKYIRDAIEGFLMQETTFPVEILIHDDASTDGTAEIVKEYAAGYPQLVKAILQAENQYSKGRMGSICAFPKVSAEFIAICEGDDYWLTGSKLETQVRYLLANPPVSLVHSARSVELPDRRILRGANVPAEVGVWTLGDILVGKIPATPTIVFRNLPGIEEIRQRLRTHKSGDQVIAYACALFGDLHCLPDTTACYRFSGSGVWSSHVGRSKALREISVHREFHRAIGLPLNVLFDRIMVEMAVSAIWSIDPVSMRRATNWAKLHEALRAYSGPKSTFALRVVAGVLRRFCSGSGKK